MKKSKTYILVNLIVLTVALGLFCFYYNTSLEDIFIFPKGKILLLAFMVLVVHLLKAIRLYIAFYGTKINFISYLKTYCKVTPVNLLFPYKIGEFFRIYCYGNLINDYPKSAITVLLDRFMDTSALITFIFILYCFYGGSLPHLAYVFIVFLLFVLFAYFIFPGLYKFWRFYFLAAPATDNTLKSLKVLNLMYRLFASVKQVVAGRGIILYILSLMSWGIELLNISFLTKDNSLQNASVSFFDYLSAALTNGFCPELRIFIFVSIILLLIFYLFLQIVSFIRKKRCFYENNDCI